MRSTEVLAAVKRYRDTVGAEDVDTLDLARLALAQRQLGDAITESVLIAREDGVTWEAIGTALGMTKQAAQQRWGAQVS